MLYIEVLFVLFCSVMDPKRNNQQKINSMFGWSKAPRVSEDLELVVDERDFDLNNDLEMLGDVPSQEGSSSQGKGGQKQKFRVEQKRTLHG